MALLLEKVLFCREIYKPKPDSCPPRYGAPCSSGLRYNLVLSRPVAFPHNENVRPLFTRALWVSQGGKDTCDLLLRKAIIESSAKASKY